MKNLMLIMMCMLLALPSFSSNDKENLELSGIFISKSNVKFEVAIVNDDASRVVVQTKSNTFAYKIKLKIGKEYVITFVKDGKVKELFVDANEPGYMQVDIDFATDNAAQLCYSDKHDDYHLILLYNE